MGTFTLTGPGASVDRSSSNPLTWTWTAAGSNESLHRWRLQYRVVGSGTWLNAIVAAGTNLLANGSAETALTDWSLQNYQSTLALARIAGGRHAGSGSWQAEVTQVAIDPYDNDPTDESFTINYPPPGSLVVPVVAGGRYVASAWVQGVGAGAGRADLQLSYVSAAGTSLGPYWYNPGVQRGSSTWDAVSADKVAPAGAAWAVLTINGNLRGGVGAATRIDEMRLERVDGSPDTAVADGTGNLWTFRYTGDVEPGSIVLPSNFLAAGNYEFRLEAWTADYVAKTVTQNFSNTVTSTMVTASAAPTITSPTPDGAVVPANPTNVTATYAAGPTQIQYRVLDGATVKYDSGALTILNTSTSDTRAVPFTEGGGVGRTIQVRVATSSVWSAWATRTVTVTYTPPATPTLTAAWEDTYGLGLPHAVRVTTTNPAPTGTQPAVTQNVVEWRPVGATAALTAGATAPGTPLVWHAAPNLAMQVRVTAVAANGTSTSSSWATVTGTPGVRGVTVYDPANPSGIRQFRLNDDGVDDDEKIESALLTFSGRQYPIAEYGAGTARQITVPLLSMRTDTDVAALKLLLRSRTPLVYRDKRGRAVLARMELGTVRDAFYGYTTGLTFDVLDSWGV